jgi:Kef-type K+ transport system membrane component KefB
MIRVRPVADQLGGRRQFAGYLLLVVVPLGVVAVVLANARGESAAGAAAGEPIDFTYRLVLASVAIVLGAHLCGALAGKLGQPRVVGQMLCGVLLGPPVLGAFAPAVRDWLLPPQVLGSLTVLAQLGVVFFMFLVGLELPIGTLRRTGRAALTIGHAGVSLPFLGGVVLALTLLATQRPATAGWLPFVLFCGLAMSITAVPVLAMILTERRLLKSDTGVLAMAAAGIGDVTAWGVLALVLALSRHHDGAAAVVRTLGLTAVFVLVMLLIVRPLLARLLAKAGPGTGTAVAVSLLALVLFCAWFTTQIGVHAVFGALLAGVVVPRDNQLVTSFADRIGGVTHWLLLPLFFASVGLALAPGAFGSGAFWLTTLVVVVVASATKIVGSIAAARLTGLGRREATGLGVLMNCRGLTEIIVLQIGLSAGLIGRGLFTTLVVLALVTTVVVGPLLKALGIGGEARLELVPELDRAA